MRFHAAPSIDRTSSANPGWICSVSESIFLCSFPTFRFLRTPTNRELLAVRNKDVSQESPTSIAVISLGLTKAGKRVGASESVTITEEDTLRRLWQWKQHAPHGASLFPPAHQWRKLFHEAVQGLGLEEYQYRLYSIRRGGATFYAQKHVQLDRLLLQGRWQSSRTARLYVNSGLATLAEFELNLQPHAKVFHRQFLRARQTPLPQLERATRGRARGTGSKNSRKKRIVKKTMRVNVPRSGGAQNYPHSLAHTYPGLAGKYGGSEELERCFLMGHEQLLKCLDH